MVLVIQYCIQNKKKMDLQQIYEHLTNSVYVTIGLVREKDISILRNLYVGQSYKYNEQSRDSYIQNQNFFSKDCTAIEKHDNDNSVNHEMKIQEDDTLCELLTQKTASERPLISTER